MTVVDKKALRHEMYRKKIPRSYIAFFALLVLMFVTGSYALFGFYLEHWYSGPARFAASLLPLPAVFVENDIIWYREVAEFAHVFTVAKEEEGLDIDDPFSSALSRTVSNTHLEHFARELNVTVSRQEIQEFEIDGGELNTFLDEVSWTEAQYRRYVVEPLLLAQKTEAAVFSDRTYQTSALERIENVERDIELGIRFDDLAVQYSDDVSGSSGGYIGFFTQESMPEGLEEVFEAEERVPSAVLEIEDAFVIAQVYDEITIAGEREQVALQIISVNKTGLSEALDAFAENQRVRYLAR